MRAGIGVPRTELCPRKDVKDLLESWGIKPRTEAQTQPLSAGL